MKDSEAIQFLMCVRTSNLLKHFNIRTSLHATHQGSKKASLIKGEALRLLRTNSSRKIFEEQIQNLKSRLQQRGYPENLVQRTFSEVQFGNRKLALLQKPKENKRILPFVTQCNPAVPNLKQIFLKD